MKRLLALFLVLGCVAMGCGPTVVEIHGKVTLDGAAVPDAQIQFVSDDATLGPGFARAAADGSYRVLLRQGNYTVRILAQKKVPPPPGTIGLGGLPLKEITVDALPERYNAKSELRTTVSDAKELNFELMSEPR